MSEEAGEQFVTMLIMIIITTRTTWNERTTWNTQKRLHPLEAKSKNQTQRMELKHRGVTNEIKLFSAISATRERWFVSKIPRSDTDEPGVTSCTTRQERERWFTTFSPPNRSASTCRGAHFE